MKKFILGTNWKMNKTTKEGLDYTSSLTKIIPNHPDFDFFIVPPYVQLWKQREAIDAAKSPLKLGAQNVHYEDFGQFTGEISPVQLKEIGIEILEIGHCERRKYFNETDYTVNLKVLAGLRHGFIPLICIGDSMQEKEFGVSAETLAKSLKIALHGVSAEDAKKVCIAYEPYWAIGVEGIPAEPEVVAEIHTSLRNVLIDLYGEETAREIPILFGGSVNINNAVPYAQCKDVDGLFIGRAAWHTDSFETIMNALEEAGITR